MLPSLASQSPFVNDLVAMEYEKPICGTVRFWDRILQSRTA
jgi:hypothetical protein